MFVLFELIITQFADHVSCRISQFIKGISRILQNLLKYFNSTTISTFFILPATGALPIILALNLNDSESVMLTLGSFLWYYHKRPDVFA